MATTTIHNLSYKLLLDTRDFEKKGKATRAGIREQKKAITSILTPLDKYQLELAKLNKLQKAGLVTGEAYDKVLKKLGRDYQKTTAKAKGFSNALLSVRTGLAAIGVGFSVGTFTRGLDGAITRMDALGKAALGAGVSSEFLSGLEFMAQRTSGFREGQATKAIEKMTVRISKGTSEAAKAVKQLGLSLEGLNKLGVEEQFKLITAQWQSLATAGEQAAVATALFDDEQARLALTLSMSNEETNEAIKLGKELGAIYDEEATRNAADAADAINTLSQVQDGFFNRSIASLARTTEAWFRFYAMIRMQRVRMFDPSFSDADRKALEQGIMGGAPKILPLTPGTKAKADAVAQGGVLNDRIANAQMWRGMKGALGNSVSETGKQYSALFRRIQFRTEQAFQNREIKGKKPLITTQTTSDPMDSITAGSSEAFKIANRIKASSVETSTKKTAENTKKTNDWLGLLVGQFSNAEAVGL